MLVNRDQDHDHPVKVDFANAETTQHSFFTGSGAQITFGQAQFQWHPGSNMGTRRLRWPATEINCKRRCRYAVRTTQGIGHSAQRKYRRWRTVRNSF